MHKLQIKFSLLNIEHLSNNILQARKLLPNGEEAGLGIIPSKQRWERKMKCKNRTLRFGAYGRSSTSLDRYC